jgi:hypothetical protein
MLKWARMMEWNGIASKAFTILFTPIMLSHKKACGLQSINTGFWWRKLIQNGMILYPFFLLCDGE